MKKYKPPILTEDRGTPLVLDRPQDAFACECAIKKLTHEFWHMMKESTNKIIGALNTMRKSKHTRFMLKATRKNLTRRKEWN